jgi:putative membrane protein
MGFLLRWLITFIAVFVASAILAPSGLFRIEGIGAGVVFAAVQALLNAVVRPIVLLLTCPIQILTLGLFTLVINALIFLLAANTAALFGAGVVVGGFLGAIVAAILVSIVGWALNVVVRS